MQFKEDLRVSNEWAAHHSGELALRSKLPSQAFVWRGGKVTVLQTGLLCGYVREMWKIYDLIA